MKSDKKTQDVKMDAETEIKRLKFMLTSSPAVTYVSKAFGDFAATFISENVSNIIGYQPSNFLDKPSFWADHIHPDDKEHIFNELNILLEKEYHVYEYRFIHKDGSYRWMRDEMRLVRDASGNPLEIIGSWSDFTRCKKAEESSQASEAELKAIIENSATGITLSDLEGHIIRTNPAHQRIFGYSQAELETMTFADFTYPGDIGKNSELFKKLLAGEILQLNMTKRFIHKNGHTVWANVKLSLIRDHDNNPLFVVGIVEDITERKKEEMIKDALIEKLQKATEEIKSLQGIVPICMHCKQIRDDKGFWNKVENYIEQHTEAKFSHGICPSCLKEFHPDIAENKKM